MKANSKCILPSTTQPRGLWSLPSWRSLSRASCSARWSLALTPPPRTRSAVVVNFDVPVDPGSSSLMADAVATAKSSGAPAIVIEMNTPGGYLSDMLDIVASIQQANQSGIPTYTYVPPDALAASAGSYIAMASNGILDGSRVGDWSLHPDSRGRHRARAEPHGGRDGLAHGQPRRDVG